MGVAVPDLTDAETWARPDAPALIAELRERWAVLPADSRRFGALYHVLRHREASEVLRDTATFSSRQGSLLTEHPTSGADRMMALSDPPQHRRLRAPVEPAFQRRGVTALADRVRELAETSLDAGLAGGEHGLEAIGALCTDLPLAVMSELFSVPVDDRPRIRRLSDAAFLSTDPAVQARAHRQLLGTLLRLVQRADPADGTVVGLLAARRQAGGGDLTDEEIVLTCDNILVGGVQTVRHTAGLALLACARDAGTWARLRTVLLDGDASAVQVATNELLRWTASGLHVLRTATADTVLGEQPVPAGARVAVWVPAANRDPEVFDEPETIVLDRSPNPHLTLGVGPHYCIGGLLAKQELIALLQGLARRAERISLAGRPRYNASVINFGLESLPLRVQP